MKVRPGFFLWLQIGTAMSDGNDVVYSYTADAGGIMDSIDCHYEASLD